MDQDQVALSRLVRLPLEHKEQGGVSIVDLAREAVPQELIRWGCIDRSSIRGHLELDQSLVKLWLDWSADKRCGDGVFFTRRDDRFVVGGLGQANREVVYEDPVEACAGYIEIELASWLKV